MCACCPAGSANGILETMDVMVGADSTVVVPVIFRMDAFQTAFHADSCSVGPVMKAQFLRYPRFVGIFRTDT